MRELTYKQKAVLEFIREKARQGIPPTIREIARHMGFSSTGTVRDYLAALESKGFIKRGERLSRCATMLKYKARAIPIIATITAGRPNTAYEDIEGYVDPDDLFLGRLGLDDVFALRVKGESMVDAGILDGDIAVIKKSHLANNGDIVAALLDNNEATLKRFRHKNGNIFLEAANTKYPPIHKDFKIIGKLITLLRKY